MVFIYLDGAPAAKIHQMVITGQEWTADLGYDQDLQREMYWGVPLEFG
jgi:hypothetical protein